MAELISRLPVAVFLCFIVSALALTCPSTDRPLPTDTCFVVQDSADVFSNADDACLGDLGHPGLLVLSSNDQFPNLASYAQVLGNEDPENLFWVGYAYASDGTTLQDITITDVESTSVLLDEDNYGGDQVAAASGVCVAIGGDGLFYRRSCNDQLPYLCSVTAEAPSANLTVDSRFVAESGSVTLTCSTGGSDVDITWMASIPATSDPQPLDNDDSSTFTIDSFSSDDDSGLYYCVAANVIGVYVSDPVALVADSTSTTDDVPTVTLTTTDVVQFGKGAVLTCSYSTAVTIVQWFINGNPTTETGRVGDSSLLAVVNFQEEGYYQCFVSTENGNTAGDGVLLNAQSGTPSSVDELTAEAYTRTELSVSWLCPEYTNTHDPALLRYTLLYHQGIKFDSSSATMQSDILPVLLTGEEDKVDCIVETMIDNLVAGTTYVVKVIAMTTDGIAGEEADLFAVATTFGSVPEVITDLKVQRSVDNKQVVAQWGSVETTPPVGTVARYQIQYRDSEKGSVSTVFHSPRFNFLVVTNVINANSYEVRVSSGVIVRRDPLMYEYSAYSEWVMVDGIITVIPPVPPTDSLATPSIGPLAGGVAVGVSVFVLILVILITGAVCLVYKRSQKETELERIALDEPTGDPIPK